MSKHAIVRYRGDKYTPLHLNYGMLYTELAVINTTPRPQLQMFSCSTFDA
jgi:hypothetical protein